MRSLQKNYRTIHYATPVATEPIIDEYGNDTLEVRTIYSDVKKLNVNVSANVGEEAVNTFGSLTDYSRTITCCNSCPLVEGSRVWFNVSVEAPNNYVVVKVADSKNGFLVALREVTSRG